MELREGFIRGVIVDFILPVLPMGERPSGGTVLDTGGDWLSGAFVGATPGPQEVMILFPDFFGISAKSHREF